MLRIIGHRNDLFIKSNFYKLTWISPYFLSLNFWLFESSPVLYFLIPCIFFLSFFSEAAILYFLKTFCCSPFSISTCFWRLKKKKNLVNFNSLSPAEGTFLELTERRMKRQDLENTCQHNPRIFSSLWKCFLLEPTQLKYGCILKYLKTSKYLPYYF